MLTRYVEVVYSQQICDGVAHEVRVEIIDWLTLEEAEHLTDYHTTYVRVH